ncbi:MAG: RagB/SusD family nutrient uptake outer membrane protein [Pseudobacter sp.]|uniref:RagB/SusD family nutrient uptake outer membrane protein n=1 Tax=Pseudobacter sp. TaxID=2045420 RepID=UPI003F7DAF7E
MKYISGLLLMASFTLVSCEKLITADEPLDTITAGKIFDTEAKAETAMSGVYSVMVNGNTAKAYASATENFAGGLADVAGALSAGEFVNQLGSAAATHYALTTSKINLNNSSLTVLLWTSAYNGIYAANTVIDGLNESASANLRDSVKKELIAEAKFLRAFSYFYLVNFFGPVPLALSGDVNLTNGLSRSSQQAVYQQIIADLKDAEAGLAADYSVGKGKRVRANRYAATALLARVYLYLGQNENAALKASEVISNTALYNLEPNLDDVFRTTSKEAIFQFYQTDKDNTLRNATPFGYASRSFPLTTETLNAFETGDLRNNKWVSAGFVNKYNIHSANSTLNGAPREYYMALRLGELYLVRAEARANGATGGLTGAIADLNELRRRADVDELDESLDETAVKAAIEKERQTELFAEWAHRWFDLKRTGKASQYLQTLSIKLPWEGDYQLLYPIPVQDQLFNNRLDQNPGYTF